MSFIQRLQESNEVLAVVIAAGLSIVIAVVGRFLSPRGRVKWAVTHEHTFLTHPTPPPPPPTQQPGTRVVPTVTPPPAQPLLVFTRTIWVQNVGRAPIEDVEIIFNYHPQHFEILAAASVQGSKQIQREIYRSISAD
jgi:hypothetical protein